VFIQATPAILVVDGQCCCQASKLVILGLFAVTAVTLVQVSVFIANPVSLSDTGSNGNIESQLLGVSIFRRAAATCSLGRKQ